MNAQTKPHPDRRRRPWSLLVLLGGAVYVVSETNQVVITQFGEPIGGTITRPGLHLKTALHPEGQLLRKTLARLGRRPEPDPDQGQEIHLGRHLLPLADHRPPGLLPARRRRAGRPFPPGRHRRRRNPQHHRQIRPDRNRPVVQPGLRAVRGRRPAGLLRGHRSRSRPGREKLAQIILENASKITPQFGVELKDVQIKRVNYVDEVQRKVFDRMIAERQRIASKYRSEGDGKSAEIRGQKERELKRIQSEAYQQGPGDQGQGRRRGDEDLRPAYNLDPEFYQFMKSLETYRTSLDKDTWLLLTTDSEFLKYLKSSGIR